jgi:hypothetical protein
MSTDPIHFLLPVNRETRWSDMLATFIQLDPEPMRVLLEVDGPIDVHREVTVQKYGECMFGALPLAVARSSSSPRAALRPASAFAPRGRKRPHPRPSSGGLRPLGACRRLGGAATRH